MNQAENIEAIYPLAPLQEGMLFHTVADPDSGIYVEQSSYTLDGELDPEHFRAAWRAVIERHAVLRTAFAWRGLERMVQVAFRAVETPLLVEDWRQMGEGQQEEPLRTRLAEDRRRGFELAKAPLLRLLLLRLSDRSYRFVITYHHALLDGWSFITVLKEMAHTYEALARGAEPHLPEPRQYRDFIRWLERRDAGSAERFWRERLRGVAGPTPLPFEGGADALGRVSAGDEEIGLTLPRELTAELAAFTRRNQVSLSTVAQAAWAVVLGRASGEEDVLFGVTVSGRPAELEGVEQMVGLFINTIPVRVRIDDTARVLDWLRRLQSERLADYEFQHARLVDIQKWAGPANGRSLFDSVLVFENYPVDVFERRQGDQSSAFDIRPGITREIVNYPLCLVVCPGEELRIQLAYSSARLSRAAAERIGGWLEDVLRSFVRRPNAAVRDVALVSPEEEREIVRLSHGPLAARPAGETAHGLIELQARARPAHPAVIASDGSLSYGELEAWANRLARHMRGLGVAAGARVGVFLDRSGDMVVALLAILKAGATYVPLDPGYPSERLAYIAQDCSLQALLTTADLAARAPVRSDCVIALDSDGPLVALQEPSALNLDVPPESPAYIIYTSGSTGQPKGIAVSHAALAGHCRGWIEFCELTPQDRVLQFASLCFDASVEQIFPTLVAGASVVVRARLPWSTAEFVRNGIETDLTVVDLPAAYFAECARNWEQVKPLLAHGRLRLVTAGGDRVSGEGLARWRESAPRLRLVNAYGPTEATITATAGDITSDAPDDNVPIGRPLPNRAAYVLDAQMRHAPFGLPGELYLGGEGLASCYWGKPALTAACFVPDPFSREPGARLYRTGDRVRRTSDGTLEFLGRADDQVKIRGYRVEPREIERAIQEHEGVADCLALPYDSPNGRELVAYVVGKAGAELREEDLRAHLSACLPRFVIPRSITLLEAFPMLPNDSVDRKRLPPPSHVGPAPGERVAPRNAFEVMLCELWAEVLVSEPPGVTDDFFAAGGHSLDATRLVSRVYDTFGVELPLRTIFERPTVAELSVAVAELQAESLSEEDEIELIPQAG